MCGFSFKYWAMPNVDGFPFFQPFPPNLPLIHLPAIMELPFLFVGRRRRRQRYKRKYPLFLPTCGGKGRMRRRRRRKEREREKISSIISYPKHRITEMFFPLLPQDHLITRTFFIQ
jgi:hypothetical protein